MIHFILILLATALLSCLLTFLARLWMLQKKILDHPGPRSSHHNSVPRGGGLGFALVGITAMVIGWLLGFFPRETTLPLASGSLVISIIGFLDDRFQLSPRLRLLFQFAAALIFLLPLLAFFPGGMHPLGRLAYFLFFMLSIVWSVNLFNFMDGIDLIAGQEALFIFSTGGYFFWASGAPAEALLCWLTGASVLGFLFWNLPPAKIFMGDVGSYFLGFLIAAFAVIGKLKYGLPLLLWVILYGYFCYDSTLTLIRKCLKKEKWYKAHRSHAYQRLHQAGWSHGKVSGTVMAINTILLLLALTAYYKPPLLTLSFIAALGFLTAFYVWVEFKKPVSFGGA